jgi:hypothetical protein
MFAWKIFLLQAATDAPFETTDAKATAKRLHARRLPHRVANVIDLGLVVYVLLNALIPSPAPRCFRRFDGFFQLGPIGHARCRVDAAINTV